MLHLIIAIVIPAILGILISRPMGTLINDALNKNYPASPYRKDITKKSLKKEKWRVLLSFQTLFNVALMIVLSTLINSIIMAIIRELPIPERTPYFFKGDFSEGYWCVLLAFFTVLYTTVTIVCVDFYFHNLINNTPDRRLDRLIDPD